MKKDIIKVSADIGEKMIENGAEISRAEDTVRRILEASGISGAHIICTYSFIIINTDHGMTARRITRTELNLYEIDRLNSMSRELCGGKKHNDESNEYGKAGSCLLTMLATGSFCLYFGGSIKDAVISGLIGLAVSFKRHMAEGIFARTLTDSVLCGILSCLPTALGMDTHPDKIMIGTIMLLVPGLTVGNAMRDIMNGDVLSGLTGLTEAIFLGVSIALGFAVAVAIF